MPSTVVNTLIPGGVVVPTLVTKLTRGKNINLGTLGANGNVVAFTVPEPSRDHQGNIVIQVAGNLVGTTALEVSIDQATTWAVLAATVTLTTTGQPGGDTAAVSMAQYNVSGFGAGAQFRFGLSAFTSGTGTVWVLCG